MLSEHIKQKACEIGFDLVGITTADSLSQTHAKILKDWLSSGFSAQMTYMSRNLEKRLDPAKLLKGAQSVICVALNYTPHVAKTTAPASTGHLGRVSNYAQYEDYHEFMKDGLTKLAEFISTAVNGDKRFKICVDSAPVAERTLAQRAGLGFIGKNHMLINPELGGQVFLGEIITDLELNADGPMAGGCGDCEMCLTACPGGALRGDGSFDANRCVSYLTIEYEGEVAAELKGTIGDRVFGCDECVKVCPYTKGAPSCKNENFRFFAERGVLDLERVLELDEEAFAREFAETVFERAGLPRLKRNARICLDNAERD